MYDTFQIQYVEKNLRPQSMGGGGSFKAVVKAFETRVGFTYWLYLTYKNNQREYIVCKIA